MANDALTRVEVLIAQNRYQDAEMMLRNLLAADTNNTSYLLLLGEVNYQQDKISDAKNIADHLLGLAPDNAEVFYLKSRIAAAENQYDNAELFVQQAINLDPYDADFFAFFGQIKIVRKEFKEALSLADQALEISPDNILALNTRSTALVKLNRKEESFQTIEGALREDPNNAYTHANYGWGLLEKKGPEEALVHFEEALKIDPNNQYAQAGILEAIKAKNIFYRWFLRYAFFMSKLTAKYQWAVIIGVYVAFRALNIISKNNEAFRPFITPVIIFLSILAFSTWVITPISNLFLRLNKYGKFLLSAKEKLSSNFVALSFMIMLAGIVGYFLLHIPGFLIAAAFGFIMMAPLGVMFEETKTPGLLLYYTIGLAAIGMIGAAIAFTKGEVLNWASILFGLGFFAFQWIANYQLIHTDE